MLRVFGAKEIVEPQESIRVRFVLLSGFPEFGPSKIKVDQILNCFFLAYDK